MMDQYKGGKEEDKYAILKVSGISHVYKDSSLKNKVKSSGDSEKLNFYDLSQMAGTSNAVNVVGLTKQNNAYKIYVPTSVKKSSGQDCSYTNSMRGSYPNYGGRTKVSVDTNTANYSCDYVDYDHGKYWISKNNTTIINDKSIPNEVKTYNKYDSDGDLLYKFYVDGSSNKILYTNRYNKSGKVTTVYEYVDGTKYGDQAGNMRYKFHINTSNNTIKYMEAYKDAKVVTNVYEYQSGTKYSNHDGKVAYRYIMDTKTNNIKYAYGYNTSGKITTVYEHFSGTKYGQQNGNLH